MFKTREMTERQEKETTILEQLQQARKVVGLVVRQRALEQRLDIVVVHLCANQAMPDAVVNDKEG